MGRFADIGDVLEVLGGRALMTILIKPFLYLIAFGPMAVLFGSAIGLAGWLLMMCVRAGARLAIIKRAHYPQQRPRLPQKGLAQLAD
jgi:uncharacterized membrane protein YedE/YeeE